MTISVFVSQTNGEFCASVVGSPELRCVRPSRAEAISGLQSELAQKAAAGELLNVEVPAMGVSGLAGRFHDDPELCVIRDEIYRNRDAQPSS